jgi:7-cyano-7-deazaguanine reductase
MPRSKKELKHHILGSKITQYETQYNPNLLECIENKNPHSIAWTSFICTEFTSLCPKTGQPDFAKIFINYIAHKKMVESKSLKLYLFSFRNHGDFHEDCVETICQDISKLIKPRYLEVIGEFTPRGGIAIFPFSQYASPEWESFRKQRLLNYRPGGYSVTLDRVY